MRIDLIIFWCVVGLVVLIAMLGSAFLIGYKKGVHDMVWFFKSTYEVTKENEHDE